MRERLMVAWRSSVLKGMLRGLRRRVPDDPDARLAWALVQRAVSDCAYMGVMKGLKVAPEAEWEIVESAERWLRHEFDGAEPSFTARDALRLAGLDWLADMGGDVLAELAVMERAQRFTVDSGRLGAVGYG